MYILTVIPIEKGLFLDELTYFSKHNIAIGSLIEAPVRKKNIKALVIKTQPAGDMKSALKSNDFSLKKITKVVAPNWLSPFFLAAIKKTSFDFAVSMGQLLKTVTPQIILDTTPDSISTKSKPATNKTAGANDIFALQEIFDERISFYRGLTREEFAKKKSIIICTPTYLEAEKIFNQVNRGIENFAIILHNNLKESEILTAWSKAITSNHPLLIVTTPLFLSLPKYDIGCVIIEQESSPDYYTLKRPFIDMRHLCEAYAKELKAKLFLGDTTLRVETIARSQNKDILNATPIQYRILPHIETKVVDMHIKISKNKTNDANKLDSAPKDTITKKDFTIISPEVKKIITAIKTKKTRGFFLVGRKGLAPLTICNDCNTIVACSDCGRPLTLHQQKDEANIYICHACQMVYKNTDTCTNCLGWRLAPLGVGTESTTLAIKNIYPSLPIFNIDKNSTKTNKQALTVINKFLATPGSILIGTDMALRYLTEPIPYTVVVSIDALFSLPDFRIRENILRRLLRLKEITEYKMIIQTRLPAEKTFSYITAGNLADFYRDELKEREQFNYPPFSVLIKITREGTSEAVIKDTKKLESLFTDYMPVSFNGPKKAKDKITSHTLLKIESHSWPDVNVVEVLKSLPPRFIVAVRPISIL